MAKLLRKATRVNKAGFLFQLDVTVEKLEQPERFDPGNLSVSLSKANSKKSVCTRENYITDSESSWGEKLSMKATLYRDKVGAYDSKLYDVELRGAAGKKVLAKFVLDAAAYSSIDGRAETLTLRASGKNKGEQFVLTVTVVCQYLSPATGPGSEASSVNSYARKGSFAGGAGGAGGGSAPNSAPNTASTTASGLVSSVMGGQQRPPVPPQRSGLSARGGTGGGRDNNDNNNGEDESAGAGDGEDDQDLSGFDAPPTAANNNGGNGGRAAPPPLPPKRGTSVRHALRPAAGRSPSRDDDDSSAGNGRGDDRRGSVGDVMANTGGDDDELAFERRRVDRLEQELETLIEEREAALGDLAGTTGRLDAARRSADEASARVKAAEARAATAEARASAAEGKLATALSIGSNGRGGSGSGGGNTAQLEEEVAALREQNDRLAEALEKADSGGSGATAGMDEAEAEALRDKAAAAMERVEYLEEELRTQRGRVADQDRQLKTMREAAVTATGEITTLTGDKRTLESRVKSLERDLEKAKAATAAAVAAAASAATSTALSSGGSVRGGSARNGGGGGNGGGNDGGSADELAAAVAEVQALLDEKQDFLQRIKQLEKDVIKAKSSRGAAGGSATTTGSSGSPAAASSASAGEAADLRRRLQESSAEQEELEGRVRELEAELQDGLDGLKEQRAAAAAANAAAKRSAQELDELRGMLENVIAERDAALQEGSTKAPGRGGGVGMQGMSALQQQQQQQQQQRLEAEVKRLTDHNAELAAKIKALESGPPPVPPRRGSNTGTCASDQSGDVGAKMLKQQKEYEQKILELIQDMTTQREAWQRMCDEVEKERDDTAQELIHAKVQLAQAQTEVDNLKMASRDGVSAAAAGGGGGGRGAGKRKGAVNKGAWVIS